MAPVLQAMAEREDRAIEWDFPGSHDAWRALQAGGADIGLISFSPGEPMPDDSFRVVPVAWQAVMVLASTTVAINQISFAQLAGVFGAEAGSDWQRWGDLGVAGDLAPRSITPSVLERSAWPTLELSRHLVLRGRMSGSALRPIRDEADLVARLNSDEAGIALAGWSPETPMGIKPLAISIEPGGVAFLPTSAAIERGDYPLQWPVYLVFRRTEVHRLYPWLRLLLSDETAHALSQSGLCHAT
ncbi:MAG: hypothetical protein IT582_09480, partial [Opitutaceae bacterium]|nr:hypothetical protein [Opitutaceae bacterium]